MAFGKIALIGSGELSESMAEVHRLLMAQVGEPVRPVFVDTLAGFELNIDGINHKAISYFKRNFGMDLPIARYRSKNESAESLSQALEAIQRANYIFAGPGSPSYGVRIWKDSRVWEAIVKRWHEGAMLVFASAAAITLGRWSIPVYEIYKAGIDPTWIDGLNLLNEIGIDAAVVPHWNNNSGAEHDTRYCFMGAPRIEALEQQLTADSILLGVDEYTTLLIDSSAHRADVYGIGSVTVRRGIGQSSFTKGQPIDFDHLSLNSQPIPADLQPQSATILSVNGSAESEDGTDDAEVIRVRASVQQAFDSGDFATVVSGLFTLSLIAGTGLEQSLYNRAEQAVRGLQALLPKLRDIKAGTDIEAVFESERSALLELLITARAELRKGKQWAAADELRNRLISLNYVLADTPQGTSWQRAIS